MGIKSILKREREGISILQKKNHLQNNFASIDIVPPTKVFKWHPSNLISKAWAFKKKVLLLFSKTDLTKWNNSAIIER